MSEYTFHQKIVASNFHVNLPIMIDRTYYDQDLLNLRYRCLHVRGSLGTKEEDKSPIQTLI